MSDTVRGWRCLQCGSTLGQVRRNGRGTRQLLLYREAVRDPVNGDEHWGERADVDVLAVVEGYVADVRCSVCGAARTWVPGEEALRELLKKCGIKEIENHEPESD